MVDCSRIFFFKQGHRASGIGHWGLDIGHWALPNFGLPDIRYIRYIISYRTSCLGSDRL
ncbi:hypothetical protein QUA62_06490 [Microcoleus sp. MON1_C1]|uniref:hypothetical protein n=1 Tax=Microcoleus sp. MON1_C1 TaxID=2818827 RepID=UPI002FD22994